MINFSILRPYSIATQLTELMDRLSFFFYCHGLIWLNILEIYLNVKHGVNGVLNVHFTHLTIVIAFDALYIQEPISFNPLGDSRLYSFLMIKYKAKGALSMQWTRLILVIVFNARIFKFRDAIFEWIVRSVDKSQ